MYWIYENWQAGPHKLVIHDADCAFCNNGHGLAGGSDPAHGRWHGSFTRLDDAERFLDNTKAVVKKRHTCVA